MKCYFAFIFIFTVVLSACRQENNVSVDGTPVTLSTLTVMTHDSFDISAEVLAAFEEEYQVTVSLLPAGDTGAALNQAILSRDVPLADVFFGIDNTFMGRALDAGIFIPYASSNLANVPNDLKLDSTYQLTPIDFGDVCLNYDIAKLEGLGLDPPQSLFELTESAYADLLVVEDPATSSPGLAFLLATIETFGTEGDYTYLNFWEDLRHNGVLVTSGWEEAYWGQFSAASDGNRPLVVSYASSPAAEVYYNELEKSLTASILGDLMCFRQVEFAGILAGTANQDLAENFIDFMLTDTFQTDIPLHMFVYPANEQVTLPDVFVQWATLSENPAYLTPEEIDINREAWIEAWSEVVLR